MMEKTISAFKTYSVAAVPFVLAWIPNSCDEWTSLLEMLGAMLAIVLILVRLRKESKK